MKRFLRFTGGLLVLSGVVMMVFILASQYHTQKIQKELMDLLRTQNNHTKSVETTLTVPKDANKWRELKESEKTRLRPGADGILHIPSIHLEAAVVNGASPEQLSYALGRTGHGIPGFSGAHPVIAGHNSGTRSEFFKKLNHVKEGEEFSFETSDGLLQYKVVSIEVVRPDQTDRVNPVPDKSLMTLVTCYPENSNQFRLLVTGELMVSSHDQNI